MSDLVYFTGVEPDVLLLHLILGTWRSKDVLDTLMRQLRSADSPIHADPIGRNVD